MIEELKFKLMFKSILKFEDGMEVVAPRNLKAINYAGNLLRNCLKHSIHNYEIKNFYFLIKNKNKFKVCIYIEKRDFSIIILTERFPCSEIKGINNGYVKEKYYKYLKSLAKKLELDYNILSTFIFTKEQYDKRIDLQQEYSGFWNAFNDELGIEFDEE